MSNQAELQDIQEFDANVEGDDNYVELNDEVRVAFALYLSVLNKGKVTKDGTLVPDLNIHKLSRVAEVSNKNVSKNFDRLRAKGFLANTEHGQLVIPNFMEFEDWLKAEGAAID